MKLVLISALVVQAAAAEVGSSPGTTALPLKLQGIGIEQRLGAQLPLDAQFTGANGSRAPLRSYLSGRPVLLALVYYECPMLCSQILNGVVAGLRPLSLRPGRDFDVVAISINPAETPSEAADKQAFYSRRYSPSEGSAGWHFLVGDEPAISAVTQAAGFHYRYDPITRMFVHASGIMVLTPAGKMARYFYGVQYEPKDLKLGLIEASGNRIGSPADQVLLFCYHYDPSTGKYGAAVMRLTQAAAVLFLVFSGIALAMLFRRELRVGWHVLRRIPHA